MAMAPKKDTSDLVLSQRRRVPKDFEEGRVPNEYDHSSKGHVQRVYFKAFDLLFGQSVLVLINLVIRHIAGYQTR